MFCLYLQQLADSGASCSHKPDDEVPFSVTIRFKFRFEKLVIGITDDIFKEILLLYFNELHLKFIAPDKLKILVESLQAQVDCLRSEMLQEKALVSQEVFLFYFAIVCEKMIDRPHIGYDGVFGQV